MSTTNKKKVTAAVSEVILSFHAEIMARVIAVEAGQDEVNVGRKGIMATLAATYGERAIMYAKQGGISGNAMRTDDSIKAEASRLGITPGAARELYFDIVKPINAMRANAWEDYQAAHFGAPEKKAVAPKDEPENIKALKAEKAEHEHNAKVNKAEAKMADARAMLADTDEEKEREKKLAKDARALAKYQEEQAKDCAARIKEEAEDNAGADAYGTLCEALKKLGEKYKAHKDEETSELAKQVLALL
jgi:hypothetical protein